LSQKKKTKLLFLGERIRSIPPKIYCCFLIVEISLMVGKRFYVRGKDGRPFMTEANSKKKPQKFQRNKEAFGENININKEKQRKIELICKNTQQNRIPENRAVDTPLCKTKNQIIKTVFYQGGKNRKTDSRNMVNIITENKRQINGKNRVIQGE